jgi:hypothetical protein
MLKPATVKVDGTEYTLGHWDPVKALENWAWLLASVGDGAKEIFKLWLESEDEAADESAEAQAARSKKSAELGLQVFGIVIDTIKNNVPPHVYADKMLSFCSDVIGPKGKVDRTYFTGRIMHMHKVVMEVLRFQYSDFLDAALSNLK